MSAFLDSNVATVLAAGWTSLYTLDLQHRQVIDGRLAPVNPFLPVAAP